ncbi:MAG TPA: hypothetical protein VH063_17685 [Gaiellaceae bacterium]|jgi:hypothetical protein|nr:hypothetical protein [Gaiellaceae bacterium]
MRRRIWIVVALVVAIAAVAGLGRYESASASRAQVDGMKRVLATIGPRWSTAETSYRLTPGFDCLLYRAGEDPYALELCFDQEGRVVEAIDRRGSTPKFFTLQYDPGAATLTMPRPKVLAAFAAAGAISKSATSLPLGNVDIGPILVPKKPAHG